MSDVNGAVSSIEQALRKEPGVRAVAMVTIDVDGVAYPAIAVEAESYSNTFDIRVRATATGHFSTPPAVFLCRDIGGVRNGHPETVAKAVADARSRDECLLFAPAGSPAEIHLVQRIESLLGVNPVGIDDDFFTIGLDSLAAVQLSVELDEMGPGVTDAANILELRTVRRLAAHIATLGTEA